MRTFYFNVEFVTKHDTLLGLALQPLKLSKIVRKIVSQFGGKGLKLNFLINKEEEPTYNKKNLEEENTQTLFINREEVIPMQEKKEL